MGVADKDYQHNYYKKNIEKLKAYRKANKEKINDWHRAYRKANKEKMNEKRKIYRQRNKEKMLFYDKTCKQKKALLKFEKQLGLSNL